MYRALPCELTQAHIADLHRQTERDRTAYRARRAAGTLRPRTGPRSCHACALLAGRTPRSAS
jgi:hypothetical protein